MIVCLISMSAFAQSGDTKKLLEDRLREFAEAYTTIITHKNKQKVLQFFAKDATSNIFVFNISGRSRVQNSDIAGFENYLDNIMRSSGITLGYDIEDIIRVDVSGDVATVVYKVNYETKIPDGI